MALMALASQVQSAERRFMPVPQPTSQRIEVINGMPIVSGVGKQLQAAASVASLSSKQGRLMVSIKNQGAEAVALSPQAVVASAAGQVLSLREAAPAAESVEAPERDCSGSTGENYTRCITDNANRRAQAKAAGKSASPSPEARIVQPGQVFATQYYLELPRKKRGELANVQVTVELGGERLAFEFKEVE